MAKGSSGKWRREKGNRWMCELVKMCHELDLWASRFEQGAGAKKSGPDVDIARVFAAECKWVKTVNDQNVLNLATEECEHFEKSGYGRRVPILAIKICTRDRQANKQYVVMSQQNYINLMRLLIRLGGFSYAILMNEVKFSGHAINTRKLLNSIELSDAQVPVAIIDKAGHPGKYVAFPLHTFLDILYIMCAGPLGDTVLSSLLV